MIDTSKTSTKILATISALIGIIIPILGGFIFMENRYAHKMELANQETYHAREISRINIEFANKIEGVVRTLELRDNINYFQNSKNIIESNIERINSTIKMYEQKLIDQNGILSASDQTRLNNLKDEYRTEQTELQSIERAIDTLRMSISTQ